MNTRVKAFTLVELIISIVIVGLLAWVIFSTYRTILDITVRVENEKIVANEMLFAHQVIQNLVDNYTIDYNRYGVSLVASGGRDYSLFFTGRWGDSQYVWSYEITLKSNAIIMVKNWWNSIPLTDSGSVDVSSLYFQIIPYNVSATTGVIPIGSLYFNNTADIYHPAFWMYGEMKIKNYRPTTYIWSVRQPIQSFFNIRSY